MNSPAERYAAHQMADYVTTETEVRVQVVLRGAAGTLHYSLPDGNLLACSSTTLDELTIAAKRAAQ